MKDREYSLIDEINTDIKIMKERIKIFQFIEKQLRKGNGRMTIETEYEDNIEYIANRNFEVTEKQRNKYFTLLHGWIFLTEYEIKIID